MRLIVVGPSWPFRGGIARTTTALARALGERGSLAAFFNPYRQYPAWLYSGVEDRDEEACEKLAQAQSCFSLFNPLSWWRLRGKIAATPAEAVVVPFWTAAWAPLAFFLSLMGKPVVGIVHNPHDHEASPWNRWLAWWVLRRFCGFLTHARSVAWQLQVWFPGKPVKVHPLPPPQVQPVPRDQARRLLGLPLAPVIFLFFGLVRRYKGVEVLLQAARQLPKGQDWLVVVAGEVWEGLGRIQEEMAKAALGEKLLFQPRWIPEKEAALWFSAADVVVLPYKKATGSAVAAQALAYGLPLVATAAGGLGEVVEEGKNGLLVAPADVPALARALGQLLQAEVREKLSAGARASAGRWSWDSYARSLEELVRSCLAENG